MSNSNKLLSKDEFINEIMKINKNGDFDTWYGYYESYLTGSDGSDYHFSKGLFFGFISSAESRGIITQSEETLLWDSLHSLLREYHSFWKSK